MSLWDKDKEELTQQQKYSSTPTVKIKKWYEKVCTACIYSRREYLDYDIQGYPICEEEETLSNLKCFPNCSAKSCKSFVPEYVSKREGDYWEIIGAMYHILPRGVDVRIAHSILIFNEKMGDYKKGRIS